MKISGVWRKFYSSAPLPPTVNFLGATWTTTSGNKTITGTPQVGDLLVVIAGGSGGLTVSTNCVDDQGGTYSKVISANRTTTLGELAIYVRNQIVTANVLHTITLSQAVADGGGGVLLGVTNMSATGSSAVRGSGAMSNTAAGVNSAPVLSAGVPLAKNPIISADMVGSSNYSGIRSGYTQQYQNGYTTPTNTIQVISRDSGETSGTISWGGSPGVGQHCSVAVELTAP